MLPLLSQSGASVTPAYAPLAIAARHTATVRRHAGECAWRLCLLCVRRPYPAPAAAGPHVFGRSACGRGNFLANELATPRSSPRATTGRLGGVLRPSTLDTGHTELRNG